MKGFFQEIFGSFKKDWKEDLSMDMLSEGTADKGQSKLSLPTLEDQAAAIKHKEGERKEAIKSLFESKKARMVRLIKKRQRSFVSEVTKTFGLSMQDGSATNGQDDRICAVTRETLSSSSTYYMFAQLHYSSVVLTNLGVADS